MNVKFMTLSGGTDRIAFLREWQSSFCHFATYFILSEMRNENYATVYMMPYGHHTTVTPEMQRTKFSGPYRSHGLLFRDFEIAADEIGKTCDVLGGGYLALSEDRRSCKSEISMDIGRVPDSDAVVSDVKRALLQ